MKYLNFTELRHKLGDRGRSTIYRDVEKGRLPQPIKLGGRLIWPEDEVDEAVAKARDKATVEAASRAAPVGSIK